MGGTLFVPYITIGNEQCSGTLNGPYSIEEVFYIRPSATHLPSPKTSLLPTILTGYWPNMPLVLIYL